MPYDPADPTSPTSPTNRDEGDGSINNDGNTTDSTSNGSTSSSTGGTIICTELYRQKLMPESIYRNDEAFGKYLRAKYPLVLKGYYFWARPVVQHMRESKSFTNVVHIIARPWYIEMAHNVDKKQKGNFIGIILMIIGIPICWLIGFIISNKLFVIIIFLTCIVLWLLKNTYSKYMDMGEKIS